MKFLKSCGGAAVITALVIVFSVPFGTFRSLNHLRSEAQEIFIQGERVDGHSVREDLEVRRNTCLNLYKVAQDYLSESDLAELSWLLDATEEVQLSDLPQHYDFARLANQADVVIAQLQSVALSDQDASYVAGFRQELDSRAFSIARDPYTEMAETFNTDALRAFPARFLAPLVGVQELPVYY